MLFSGSIGLSKPDSLLQRGDFSLGQRPPAAKLQLAKFNRPVSNTFEAFYLVAEGAHQATHLPVAAFF